MSGQHRQDVTIAADAAAIPAAGVVGFLAQCAICPQQAVLTRQPAGEWVCPRCTEVAPPQPECLCPPVLGGAIIGSAVPCDVHFPGLKPVEWWQLVHGSHQTAGGSDDIAPSAIETGHDIGLTAAAEMFPQYLSRTAGFGDVDIAQAEPCESADDYPIGQVEC